MMKFQYTVKYIAICDPTIATDAATRERLLPIEGKPGTGNTELVREVTAALCPQMNKRNTKSATRAQQRLHEYDGQPEMGALGLGFGRAATHSGARDHGPMLRPITTKSGGKDRI